MFSYECLVTTECSVAADLLQDRLPGLLLAMDEGGDLGSRHRPVVASERDEALVYPRILQRPGEVVADLAHERLRRSGWRDHRLPARRHKARQGFRHRRQIGKVRHALG